MENEINNTAAGKSHDSRSQLGLILKEEVTRACGNRTKQTSRQEPQECVTAFDTGCHSLTKSIESLRQVLSADERGQQHAQLSVVSKHGTKGECFRQKVHQHGHELSFDPAASAHISIQNAEQETAGTERAAQTQGAQDSHSPREQSKNHRSDKNATTESDDSVRDFRLISGIQTGSVPGDNAADGCG